MSDKPGRRAVLGGAAAVGLAALAGGPATAAADPSATRGKGALRRQGARDHRGHLRHRAGDRARLRRGGRRGRLLRRRETLGREVEREIRRAGGEATYLKADVRLPEQVQGFVDAVVRRYGRLDIAVNNAGIHLGKPLHERTLDEWEDVHRTNARGVFLSIKYEIPHLLGAGGGVIVCTASSQARHTGPGHSTYSSSKRAVHGIVQAAALDYGASGIRVVAVDPGTTDTRLVRPEGIPDDPWVAVQAGMGAAERARPAEDGGAEGHRDRGARCLVAGLRLPHRRLGTRRRGMSAGRPMVFPPGFEPPS